MEKTAINAIVKKEFSYVEYHADCMAKVRSGGAVTQYSFIQSLSVTNFSCEKINGLVIRTVFSSEALAASDITVAAVDGGEKMNVRAPFICAREASFGFSSPIPCSVKFSLISGVGDEARVLDEKEYFFDLMPLSQPSVAAAYDVRLSAKYITPLSPRVKQIVLNAVNYNSKKPLIAYQNIGKSSINGMMDEARAIFLALHDEGIVYQTAPAGAICYNNDAKSQVKTWRVRMPDEVLSDKKGCCLDLAVLYCACLEEAGYRPILALIDNHAFAGFFLDETLAFPDGTERNLGAFYNRASDGMFRLALVECTLLTADKNASFKNALEEGLNNLKLYGGNTFTALDVATLHKGVFSSVSEVSASVELRSPVAPETAEDSKVKVAETQFRNVLRTEEKDRFTFWEKKLLDLTEANPLVDFRMNALNSVKIFCRGATGALSSALSSSGSIKLSLCPDDMLKQYSSAIERSFANARPYPEDIAQTISSDGRALVFGFEKTLRNLISKSQSATDETGAPTLYLCLGALSYVGKKKGARGLAPFLLLPVSAARDKSPSSYTLSCDFDDLMINRTFFEYYKQDHPDADFGELYRVGSKDRYIDIVHAFKKYSSEDILLDETCCFIANMTFAHYIMWLDVKKRKEELKRNKIIESIIENRNMTGETITSDALSADQLESLPDIAAPLCYDSTQLKAITECGKGKSFILDGPPGTGKSQTIVNMIVNAFYHGKTVLFVAEKKAALDVVANRLNKLMLGRFCLELHSDKAKKSEFFSKLHASMEEGATEQPENFDKTREDLEKKKKYIIATVNKMHERKYYFSLYDSVCIKEAAPKTLYSCVFSKEFLQSLSESRVNNARTLIERYVATADHVKNFSTNPFKSFRAENVNLYQKNEAVADFSRLKSLISDFLKSFSTLTEKLALPLTLTQNNIVRAMNALEICFDGVIYSQSLSEFITDSRESSLSRIFECGDRVNELTREYKNAIDFTKLRGAEASSALEALSAAKGFFSTLGARGKCRKLLKKALYKGAKIKNERLISALEATEEYNLLCDEIAEKCGFLNVIIGKNYQDNISETNAFRKNCLDTREFLQDVNYIAKGSDFFAVSAVFLGIYNSKNPELKLLYSVCRQKLSAYTTEETRVSEKYSIDHTFLSLSGGSCEDFIRVIDYAADGAHFGELIDVAAVNRIASRLNAEGLSVLLRASDENKFDYSVMKDAFDLALADGFIKMYFEDDAVNFFNPTAFDLELQKYKRLIVEYGNLVIESVSAKLTKELNHGGFDYAGSSPIGRLKKIISGGGRGVTIRDALLEYGDIIKKYFPCFLMSPLSAAQYLAAFEENGKSPNKFDIVIFDEASQIPTYEAVGPIARGNALIVAGDPEQMPPSAYFSAGIELSGEDIRFEDASSLLDECLAIGIPRIRLGYHYRSRHESLIAFSNHNFYSDGLLTFPSPDAQSSRVAFEYVELEENKKDSDITPKETQAIISRLKAIYTDDKTKDKSVGIIVFNMKQQEKLSDAVNEFLSANRAISDACDKAAASTGEPLFIKSLENVQGDERDIIILSVGFRKNAAGRAVVIGPIVRENGQRRLNVAVSRSKERMYVVSTIRSADFDDDSVISNKGQLFLKRFLRFAELSSFAPCYAADFRTDAVVTSLNAAITARGYKTTQNVGNSEFRVDIAVKNREETAYELGVIVDRSGIGGRIGCHDRVFVRDLVLNGLKWKILRVYALEYFKDPYATTDAVIGAIGRPFVSDKLCVSPHIEKAQPEVISYNSRPYVVTQSKLSLSYSPTYGYGNNLSEFIKEIIAAEAPVSFETIKNRVKEKSGISVMSKKAKEILEYQLREFAPQRLRDQSQDFYRSAATDGKITFYRDACGRDLYDISKEEIACAMRDIIAIQGSLSDEDLFKCTLSAFGYGQGVLTKKNRERLAYVKQWADSELKNS